METTLPTLRACLQKPGGPDLLILVLPGGRTDDLALALRERQLGRSTLFPSDRARQTWRDRMAARIRAAR